MMWPTSGPSPQALQTTYVPARPLLFAAAAQCFRPRFAAGASQETPPLGGVQEIHCHHRSSGCGVSSEHKLGAVAVSISDRRGSRARPAGLCALLLVCVLLGVGLALPLARIVHCAAGYRAAVGAATLEMHSALSGQQQHKYLAGYGLPHPSADADVFLFVGITSNGGSKERRDAIREAWADEAQASGQVGVDGCGARTPARPAATSAMWCRRRASLVRLLRLGRPASCPHAGWLQVVCKFIVPEDEQNAAMLEEQALHHDIVFAPSAGPSSTSSSTSSTVLRPSTFQVRNSQLVGRRTCKKCTDLVRFRHVVCSGSQTNRLQPRLPCCSSPAGCGLWSMRCCTTQAPDLF